MKWFNEGDSDDDDVVLAKASARKWYWKWKASRSSANSEALVWSISSGSSLWSPIHEFVEA